MTYTNSILSFASVALLALLSPIAAEAQPLLIDGNVCTIGAATCSGSFGGFQRFDSVRVINGGTLTVVPFDGADKVNTGNLTLAADSIFVDATSRIDARGAGYQTPRCGDGTGPVGTGGKGGCGVRDSGGGGAHFGRGGRGTKDCFIFGDRNSCQFPQEFEEDCGNTINAAATACTDRTDCRNNDGNPTVAGAGDFHSIWEVEFGSSGGDKGCRDGDGFGSSPSVGGGGGGRIALGAVTPAQTGSIIIEGTITADGKRGCGIGNDSGGGGAGGTVLVVGDSVMIRGNAVVSASGGLGGDTLAAAPGSPDFQDCPPGAQTGGTCDDCGGGGGGGIVSIWSRQQTISANTTFNVAGALGGVCDICRGEAGGGAGELQLNIAFAGEFCDGYDNDFDGQIDEDLGNVSCGLGSCARNIPACQGGEPVACTPTTGAADCSAPAVCNEPRVAVILDTSASMLQDLAGFPTFGDGSADHPGVDTDGDGSENDSRLFLAKEALSQVISNYPEIDFSLARYHQDQVLNQSCQLATWIECAGIFATYDDPRDNTGDVVCNVPINGATSLPVRRDSPGDEECINYAGSCGGPRRGADILSGFGSDTRDVVRWLDGRENGFRDIETQGDYCGHASEGDCELRATGPTPLEGSLRSISDYILPIRATDPCTSCRGYTVILVTDGAESCGGQPTAAAQALFDAGVQTYVVAVSVQPEEAASLNAIARSGSGNGRDATFVNQPEDLVPALTDIVAGSIRFETCNGADDDCDGSIDEGFPGLGNVCEDGDVGVCRGTGSIQCRADGSGTECNIDMPGAMPGEEVCNEGDDDCDGKIDEGLACTGTCTPTGPEVCNGVDDNCNGAIDENDPGAGSPCGSDVGQCMPGTQRCIGGMLVCVGAVEPRDELCNGLDDNCDGEDDNMAQCLMGSVCIEGNCRRPCADSEFPCPPGLACVVQDTGPFCIPTACSVCTTDEICIEDTCVDRCTDVVCPDDQTCVRGACRDCYVLGCDQGDLCIDGACETDPCETTACNDGQSCFRGSCRASCDGRLCEEGQRCSAVGTCEADPCFGTLCQPGEVCDGGSCKADLCANTICPSGNVCASTLGCIQNPCDGVRCETGRVCRVDDAGNPQCEFIGSPPGLADERVIATGKGGFACAATPGDKPVSTGVLLVFLALLLTRRRRA